MLGEITDIMYGPPSDCKRFEVGVVVQFEFQAVAGCGLRERRALDFMASGIAPHLVDDGAVKRCSACTQVFDVKSADALRKAFADHVQSVHKKHSREDVNQAAARIVQESTED